jgi:hypothetical protein
VLTLSDVLHFFANEFPGLRGWSFAVPCILLSPFDRFLFRHFTPRKWWAIVIPNGNFAAGLALENAGGNDRQCHPV